MQQSYHLRQKLVEPGSKNDIRAYESFRKNQRKFQDDCDRSQ